MGSSLTIRVPDDYILRRDVCSYGYFLLAPNRWDPATCSLTRPLDLEDGIVTLRISQRGDSGGSMSATARRSLRGSPLIARADRALSRAEGAGARRLVSRMLSLDDEGIREFHRVDPRWKRGGRGRLFRSPTFFEDVLKTVTSCNVTWPSTMNMNRRLCEVVNPAFPRPAQLARRKPAMLRARCGVGYRDARIVELAKLAIRGELDEAWFTDPANDDESVYKRLLGLPGVGPYAAGNIMQLLGRFSRLALDTESVRHGRSVLGYEGTEREVMKKVAEHYEPFGAHKFRSYWFEMWDFYESKRGPAWTWHADGVGKTFTAAQL